MSIKESISPGISALVVSAKPGNIPRQAVLKKKKSFKNGIFLLVMAGRQPEFLSKSRVKAGPLVLC